MKFYRLLSFVLLIAILTGCSSNDTNSKENENESEETTPSSNETDSSAEETQKETSSKENHGGLSEEFASSTREFYDTFQRQSDLIQSNFELMANSDSGDALIEDLIRWTADFDELLNIYEPNAKPQTEMDKKLYDITIEMVEKRKLANEHNLNGLQSMQEIELARALNYTGEANVKFSEGKKILSEYGY